VETELGVTEDADNLTFL